MNHKGRRAKGANGERELFNLLADRLGTVVRRNLSQTREGGADTISLPGIALEVKRQEELCVGSWWRQTVEQAGEDDVPVLAYRKSRQPWTFMVPLWWLQFEREGMEHMTARVGLDEFCYLIREALPYAPGGNQDSDVVQSEA
jgi:Holliday junction resolvase